MTKKAQTRPESEEIEATDFQVRMGELHNTATRIIADVFKIEKPNYKLVNDVFDRVVCFTDELELDEHETALALEDLSEAFAWAEEHYKDTSPEAVLSALDRIFLLDLDEDD